MIHSELRPFTYLYCFDCCSCYRMEYDKLWKSYGCPECTNDVNDSDVKSDELVFHYDRFLDHLRSNPSNKKRLILLYMRACGCTDEQAYDTEQINIYCSDPALLLSNHVLPLVDERMM